MGLSRHLSYVIRPRIYVILRGGLGNQLHQIAAGVTFAETRGRRLAIFPHIVDTANNVNRRGFFREIDLVGLFPGSSIRETNLIESILLRLFNSIRFKYISRGIITENNFLKPRWSYFYLLRGWFQSFEYIPTEVNFEALKGLGDSESNQITLHIRLTDFLTIDSSPLGRNYYANALNILNQQKSISKLRCFSDDIEGAIKIIPMEFSLDFPEKDAALSASELLGQLSQSKILICSKSSLCWWAANSVSSSGGVVVSPWLGQTHSAEWLSVDT
jgi:hypothetical protein